MKRPFGKLISTIFLRLLVAGLVLFLIVGGVGPALKNVSDIDPVEHEKETRLIGTLVTNDILDPTNWTLIDSPYILTKQIYHFSEVDLNIDAGVRVHFEADGSYLPDGNINLLSTAEERINFTADDPTPGKYSCIQLTEWTLVNFTYIDFYNIDPFYIIGTDNVVFEDCDFYDNTNIIIDNATCGCPLSTVKNILWRNNNFYNCPKAFNFRNDSDYLDPNYIYHNSFFDSGIAFQFFYPNSTPVSHAIWDDGNGRGNYWSDYTGEDTDGDGVGDTELPWNGVDHYPLMRPYDSDIDKDGTPDFTDPDDDGDGYSDLLEIDKGTDQRDPESHPMTPVWEELPIIELDPGNRSVTVDMMYYISDDDTPLGDLNYEVIKHYEEGLNASFSGSNLTVEHEKDSESEIWIRVSDDVHRVDANITVIANVTGQDIIIVINTPPTATASASITEGEVNLTVAFTGEGVDPDGEPLTYHWDFDDGETSTEQSPVHTFTVARTYTVRFVVTDVNLSAVSVEINITALEPPPPDPDSDKDGLLDVWERKYFNNLDEGPDGDYDFDGFTNMEEYINGTDPRVPNNTGDDDNQDDDAGDDDTSTDSKGRLFLFGLIGLAVAFVILIVIIIVLVMRIKRTGVVDEKESQAPTPGEAPTPRPKVKEKPVEKKKTVEDKGEEKEKDKVKDESVSKDTSSGEEEISKEAELPSTKSVDFQSPNWGGDIEDPSGEDPVDDTPETEEKPEEAKPEDIEASPSEEGPPLEDAPDMELEELKEVEPGDVEGDIVEEDTADGNKGITSMMKKDPRPKHG